MEHQARGQDTTVPPDVFQRLKLQAFERVAAMTIDDVQIDTKRRGVRYWRLQPAVRERIPDDASPSLEDL